jgi:hypothetical protein
MTTMPLLAISPQMKEYVFLLPANPWLNIVTGHLLVVVGGSSIVAFLCAGSLIQKRCCGMNEIKLASLLPAPRNFANALIVSR